MGATGADRQMWDIAEESDVLYWYSRHMHRCPNCDCDLAQLPKEANLMLHFERQCVPDVGQYSHSYGDQE